MLKHYKDTEGSIYGAESPSAGWTELTQAEYNTVRKYGRLLSGAEQIKEDARVAKIIARASRDKQLREGVTTADGKMWFNEASFEKFALLTKCTPEGTLVKWPDVNRNTVEMSIAKAEAYVVEGIAIMQALYGV